jgi:hypothetical protein
MVFIGAAGTVRGAARVIHEQPDHQPLQLDHRPPQ